MFADNHSRLAPLHRRPRIAGLLPRALVAIVGVTVGGVGAGGLGLARATAPVGHYSVGADTVDDNDTGITWQRQASGAGVSFAAAAAACAASDVDGGGWRLPSAKELLTIVDWSTRGPAIDGDAFPDTPAALFWSATARADIAEVAHVVEFDRGGSATRAKTTGGIRFRCVR